MKAQEIFNQIEREIIEFDLLKHPFYLAWSTGQLTTRDIREYAAEYYHHVAAFPTYLSSLHASLPCGNLRRTVLRNLCDEEIYDGPHSELWLDFAEGMGVDRDTVKTRIPLPCVQDLMATYRMLMKSPAAALAALYAYESQVPRIAKEKAQSLAQYYGADPRTCRYFDLHRFADQRHALIWKKELMNLFEREPRFGLEALKALKQAARCLWSTLDGIEQARQHRNRVGTQRQRLQ